jgi:hypothetical protein
MVGYAEKTDRGNWLVEGTFGLPVVYLFSFLPEQTLPGLVFLL